MYIAAPADPAVIHLRAYWRKVFKTNPGDRELSRAAESWGYQTSSRLKMALATVAEGHSGSEPFETLARHVGLELQVLAADDKADRDAESKLIAEAVRKRVAAKAEARRLEQEEQNKRQRAAQVEHAERVRKQREADERRRAEQAILGAERAKQKAIAEEKEAQRLQNIRAQLAMEQQAAAERAKEAQMVEDWINELVARGYKELL